MAAILSWRAMLNHRPLQRGCLIEYLYPTRTVASTARTVVDIPGAPD